MILEYMHLSSTKQSSGTAVSFRVSVCLASLLSWYCIERERVARNCSRAFLHPVVEAQRKHMFSALPPLDEAAMPDTARARWRQQLRLYGAAPNEPWCQVARTLRQHSCAGGLASQGQGLAKTVHFRPEARPE